jgi:DNA-binding transcriptional MerR regulator
LPKTRRAKPATHAETPLGEARADKTGAHQAAPLFGIQEVSKELGVTPRTLRFYEDQGLIEPLRIGTARIYSKREIGRMKLIQRGKRLGFSIKEIKEFLDLYDSDPQHVEQMRLLATRAREHLDLLELQRAALDETMAELRQIEREALARIPAE